MKRGKNRSNVSVLPPQPVQEQEVDAPPLDVLTVKIQSLCLMDENPKQFLIKVTFYDQLILSGTIRSIAARDAITKSKVISGNMTYDPSDYEKMSLMANYPLCVRIQPMKSIESNLPTLTESEHTSETNKSSSKTGSSDVETISCCNIDILTLFIDKHKKYVKKRMQPFIKPSVLHCKSWDNLPMITMELEITRDKKNERHHKVLKRANFMKITLLAAYNMLVPYNDECVYTAASRIPIQNETDFALVTFNQGYRLPKRFNSMNFNPKWESLRVGDANFTSGDVKFECAMEEIQNDSCIPIKSYMNEGFYTTVWGSFHRTLMLENSDRIIWKHIRQYHWPIEVHIYGETGGFSFMAFLNLFKLLYPGEDTVRIAVPLQWINAEAMQKMCGCDLLLTPNDKASSVVTTTQKMRSDSPGTNTSPDAGSIIRTTGSDDNDAFVVVEVKLARPLKKVMMPPHIPTADINTMLKEMEQAGPHKRECTGRGQLDLDWQSTVRNAADSLRKVPYYGMTEFCNFNRQLSETRTRVELMTSCWQDAAVYVNNKFVVQDFLRTDETFEEMLMMAHACLMKTACDTLVGVENWQDIDPILRAARHARHMQDIPHAMDLYLQLVVNKPRDMNCWRELSTCLKDVDRDWANVCINKSVMLDPRHPLSLLSKGCMLIDEDPDSAEPFFVALLALFPFWSTGWTIASAYYIRQQLFHMADQVMNFNKKTHEEDMSEELNFPRSWNYELGDWWDYTPILPGMSVYYSAADLLLRLRAISLAEVCVAQALCESGETAAYFHLVALCCRLRGNVDDALCHIRTGIEKYGEISYLRSLEAECHHKQQNIAAATAAFEKAGTCVGTYSILLSTPCRDQQRTRTVLIDLTRRLPNAYAWMALADDWIARVTTGEGGDGNETGEQVAAKTCALACAIQALKWDQRAGRAWAVLAKLVQPSARRLHYLKMARACGYVSTSEERMETREESKQSLCHHLGKALRECRCKLCEKLQF